MEAVTFSSGDNRLSGVLFGAPSPRPVAVVLCHGAFEFKDNWFDCAERLARQGFATLAFDFTGHGESEGLRGTVDMRIWPYDVREALNFLSARGYRRFGLVGWDSGGSAVVVAAAHDPRVRCAAVLSAPVLLMPSLADRVVFILAIGASKVKRALWHKPLTLSRIKELDKMCVAVDDDANTRYLSDPRLRAYFEAVPVPESLDSTWIDITRAARKVKVPMLIIHGAEDTITPLKQSRKLHDAVRGRKRLHIVDEVGHAVHLDQHRDEVYKLIAGWMKRYLR
ncbi:MAG: alpha/beta fold hydrolase [Anaerolineae bacterium]|nr:alpha/beta fold hydrolase [Anaerolineae bacterium]